MAQTVPLFPWLVEPPYAGRGRPPSAQRAVLRVVRAASAPVTVVEVAAGASRSPPNAGRCLRALARAGLVVASRGAGRARVWSATGPTAPS